MAALPGGYGKIVGEVCTSDLFVKYGVGVSAHEIRGNVMARDGAVELPCVVRARLWQEQILAQGASRCLEVGKGWQSKDGRCMGGMVN